jgi:hypothetical protein
MTSCVEFRTGFFPKYFLTYLPLNYCVICYYHILQFSSKQYNQNLLGYVRDIHEMVISSFLLRLLVPLHVSASRCHLQGVKISLFISYSRLSAAAGRTRRTIAHTYPGTWKPKHVGELISTIKNCLWAFVGYLSHDF